MGFFLNPNRFLHWLCSRVSSSSDAVVNQPIVTQDRNNPLLWAVFAWGATFTDNLGLKQYADLYASRATQLLCTATPSSTDLSRPSVLHYIQAEVLVSTYLLNSGKFVQARQRISSAACLVWTYGFHKIHSHPIDDSSLLRSVPRSDSETSLPPPADSVEEGERISALWQVYILDKTWATVLGKPSMLNEGASPLAYIDTPWPLAAEQYVEVCRGHELISDDVDDEYGRDQYRLTTALVVGLCIGFSLRLKPSVLQQGYPLLLFGHRQPRCSIGRCFSPLRVF